MAVEGVSVVIPVFNRPRQLQIAVNSVLSQKVSIPFELIVIDDGSIDDLFEVLSDLPLRVFRNEINEGVAAARNLGVKLAKYDWICFLDSDDHWLPGKLQSQVNFHNTQSDVLISQTREKWFRDGQFVNPKLKHIPPGLEVSKEEFFRRSLELCLISPSSVMISRELFLESGGFKEEMRVCEDYDLWLRLATNYRVGLVDEFLTVKFGGHPDQLSQSECAMDRFRVYAIVSLLHTENISDEQKSQALLVLRKKSSILFAGAEKRGELGLTGLYSSIYEFANGRTSAPGGVENLIESIARS